ncbi:MAG: thiolase family protein [Desulfobacteraceae bacterium]|nr:MAG: thiolase family protein [Desulfobacteraceae bacterium]
MRGNAYIIGSFSTPFKKWPEKSYRDLTREAYLGVIKDAGLDGGDEIEFAYFGNCRMTMIGQRGIRGQVCFIPLVNEGLFPARVPIINVEGACATSSMALYSAWVNILSGQADIVLAMGVEKLYFPDMDKAMLLKEFRGGMDNITPEKTIEVYEQAGQVIGKPFETGEDRTLFMDTYAMQAKYHMWKYGTTQRQIATGAAKNHNFGAQNPKAQYRFEMTVDQVMEDRLISYPLTRSMCAPIGDGAAAAIVCSGDLLKNYPSVVQNRAVRIKACAMSGGKFREFEEPSLSKVAADKAYRIAGVGPADIDLAEVHDATSFCEIYQVEMMGFCPIGLGGPFVESGATMLDGKIPVNTSGGLVSKGHPVGATGLSMIYELVTQLRGEAGPRQVPNAKLALQENGGGVIGFEEAACSVVILEKDQ